MKKFSSAFTMIELVFVIVVLGILAGVAVPRLAATRDDATVAKIRGDIASIRSGLSLRRSENLMKGDVSWPDLNATSTDTGFFQNILQQPLFAGNGINGWSEITRNQTYDACVARKCARFEYVQTPARAAAVGKPIGSFDCDHQNNTTNNDVATCQKLAE